MKPKLTDFIKVYPNALPDHVCDNIIDIFESNQSLQNLNGKSRHSHLINSQWFELTLNKIVPEASIKNIYSLILKYKSTYEQDCRIAPPLPNFNKYAPLVIKKYTKNDIDSFESHYDSIGPVSNRFLVFLWYLNDVEEGGETLFDDFDLLIKPSKGSLLIFPPYWQYRHTGMKPTDRDKYILSTYLLS